MITNPDNYIMLRGKPIKSDFSEEYHVYPDGFTMLKFVLKVYNPAKSARFGKATHDFIPVKCFGHLKDAEHPTYGLAEKLLKRLTKLCYVNLYCHANVRETVMGGRRYDDLSIVVDGFRTESSEYIVRSQISVENEMKMITEKYGVVEQQEAEVNNQKAKQHKKGNK